MHLDIRSNMRAVQRGLNDAARKQVPFATSLAVNEVLGDVKTNWEKRMKRRLEEPTPFTMRGVAIKRSTKRALRGTVRIKPIQAAYLATLEEGGTRRPKGRAILVPVRQQLNKYGNMPKGAVGRALARPTVFSGKPGKGRPGGIYQRTGRGGRKGLKLLVHYTSRSRYRATLGLMPAARKTADARMPGAFFRAMQRALRTAR